MDVRNTTTSLLALSLFTLAGSIIFFTYELNTISKEIPSVLESISNTSDKIEPVITEISEIRKLIPSIVSEAAEIRKNIPPILKEVAEIRILVPVLSTQINEIREITPSILNEAENYRKLIPDVLNEVKNTRQAIPPLLDKADRIVINARKVGQNTGEGAVTGVISGIIKAPFKLVGGVTRSVFGSTDINSKGITDKDQELAINMLYEMLASAELNESRSWSNPETGNKGTHTLKEKKLINEQKCRVIDTQTTIQDKKIIDKETTYCLNDKEEWTATE
jgi:archaellum component FlaC/surface antigen